MYMYVPGNIFYPSTCPHELRKMICGVKQHTTNFYYLNLFFDREIESKKETFKNVDRCGRFGNASGVQRSTVLVYSNLLMYESIIFVWCAIKIIFISSPLNMISIYSRFINEYIFYSYNIRSVRYIYYYEVIHCNIIHYLFFYNSKDLLLCRSFV